jgi:hypothetical protein
MVSKGARNVVLVVMPDEYCATWTSPDGKKGKSTVTVNEGRPFHEAEQMVRRALSVKLQGYVIHKVSRVIDVPPNEG